MLELEFGKIVKEGLREQLNKLLDYPYYRFIVENLEVKEIGSGKLVVEPKRTEFRLEELPVDYMVVYYSGVPRTKVEERLIKESPFWLGYGVYEVEGLDYKVGFAGAVSWTKKDWYRFLGLKKLDVVKLDFDFLILQITKGFAVNRVMLFR